MIDCEYGGKVDAVAWSPDGKRIASGNEVQTVQVWPAVLDEGALAAVKRWLKALGSSQALRSIPIMVIAARCMRWHGRPMDSISLRQAMIIIPDLHRLIIAP